MHIDAFSLQQHKLIATLDTRSHVRIELANTSEATETISYIHLFEALAYPFEGLRCPR